MNKLSSHLKKTLMAYFICIGMHGFSQHQVLVNTEWNYTSPGTLFYEKAKVKTDASNNVYTLGSTLTSNGYDWLLTKVNRKGILLWTAQFNGDASSHDIAMDLYVDNASGMVYVCGGSVRNPLDTLDACIAQFNKNTGVKNWHRYRSGPHPGNDLYVSLAAGTAGNIFAGGVSYTSGTGQDFLFTRFNAAGTELYSKEYDYTNKDDIGVKLVYNADKNRITLYGASQATDTTWDYCMRSYQAATGAFALEYRSPAGAGNHHPTDVKYRNGLYYVTGYVNNGVEDADVKTLVLDTTFNVVWEHTFDGASHLEDRAFALAVDNSGNVFVTGYTRHASQSKNLLLIKYNAVGNLLWAHTINGIMDLDDVGMDVEVVNGKVYAGGYYEGTKTGVACYDTSGAMKWQKTSEVNVGTYADLTIDDMNQVILGTPGSGFLASEKYAELYLPVDDITDTAGYSLYKAHELIVGFRPEKIDPGFVNHKGRLFAQLEEVIDSLLVLDIGQKLDIDPWKEDELMVLKIFRNMSTFDTVSISRSGYEIQVPPFWASLSLRLPVGMDEQWAITQLNTLPGIEYAELDAAFELAGPNDPLYNTGTSQSNLQYTLPEYENAHMNIDSAWMYEVGQEWVKVGIIDNGIYYTNPDFGNASEGSFAGSKIMSGKNYESPSIPLFNLTSSAQYFTHGTRMAGIIGALRNNNIGIAGIAGGDPDSNTTGVQLYDMRVCCHTNTTASAGYMNDLEEALYDGATSGPHPYNGQHIINMSIAGSNSGSDILLKKALSFAYRNEVVLVAARGNATSHAGAADSTAYYPATMVPKFNLVVGASGNDGRPLKSYSGNGAGGFTASGRGMDFLAPGAVENITTTSNNTYGAAGGTSAATAHITGVTSLMLADFEGKASFPNNLNIEDIRHILAYTANNYLSPGNYSYEAGWGKIDAKKAMDVIQKPFYSVLHFTYWANENDLELIMAPINPTVPTPVRFYIVANPSVAIPNVLYGSGNGVAKYKISGSVNHGAFMSPSAEILGYWLRDSYSDAWGNTVHSVDAYGTVYETVNGWPDVKFEYFTPDSAGLSGYVYKRMDFLQWLPHDPAQYPVRLSYSVHVYDSTGQTYVENIQDQPELVLYPNPASDQVNLSLYLPTSENAIIEMTDLSGKVVYVTSSAHYPAGKNMISLPMSTLSSGIYLVSFKSSHYTLVRKCIRQ